MRQEAPVILEEMNDWVALGGGNSGILGDENHSFGFHLPANELPPTDYSRWRDPNGANGPYVDNSYACAGDFSHKNKENLRKLHRLVLARLMRGELPMICEFIGKPWVDRPVYYWSRWNGKLELYTGSGHDHWSHISWYRSRVDQRAYLWGPNTVFQINVGDKGDAVQYVQQIIKVLGTTVDFEDGKGPVTITVDGDYGPRTVAFVKATRGRGDGKVVGHTTLVEFDQRLVDRKLDPVVKLVTALDKTLSTLVPLVNSLLDRMKQLESAPTPLPGTLPAILTGEVTISQIQYGEQNE